MMGSNSQQPIAGPRASPIDLQINGLCKAPLASQDQWVLYGPLLRLVNGINGSFDSIAAPCALPIDSPGRPYRALEFTSYTTRHLSPPAVSAAWRRRGRRRVRHCGALHSPLLHTGKGTAHQRAAQWAPQGNLAEAFARAMGCARGAAPGGAPGSAMGRTCGCMRCHQRASGSPPLRNRLRTPLRKGLRTTLCTGQCNSFCVLAEPIAGAMGHAPGESRGYS